MGGRNVEVQRMSEMKCLQYLDWKEVGEDWSYHQEKRNKKGRRGGAGGGGGGLDEKVERNTGNYLNSGER